MSEFDDSILKDFKKAFAKFPRIVRKQREHHAANQRVLKRFRPFAREFAKIQDAEKNLVQVREHKRRVSVNAEHPDGFTIVQRHMRRTFGTKFTREDIQRIFKSFDRQGLRRPAAGRLNKKSADDYDDQITVWVAYFESVYGSATPISPNVVKALIASESNFERDPDTKVAIGIAQITKATFKILQDPKGEAKDFIFEDVSIDDLRNPAVAIPMAVRWLFRKLETAQARLRRSPSAEELILEYKGLLKSTSTFKNSALKNFRTNLGKLESPSDS